MSKFATNPIQYATDAINSIVNQLNGVRSLNRKKKLEFKKLSWETFIQTYNSEMEKMFSEINDELKKAEDDKNKE